MEAKDLYLLAVENDEALNEKAMVEAQIIYNKLEPELTRAAKRGEYEYYFYPTNDMSARIRQQFFRLLRQKGFRFTASNVHGLCIRIDWSKKGE